ncbi:hypothetical protein SAMN05518672_104519 [Chitinophaga sp. CF118]|uniref:AAA family ATPase n=1 Tax=Chitinophaga sp. CF118 TaxID=1884367 RepID=UPI0008E0FF34|nr:ATP-binding protein [Chitinophaga sp. CF118]SFE11019.1 hypothetical protein SAMN05518672_104519 [Chitinophaga sp. CF118]
MILDFSIGNYRSFSTIQTLNLRSTGIVSDVKEIDQNNIVERDGQKILKTIGIYGPNGSGKSNLLQGIKLFRQLVESSLESEAIMDFAAEPFALTNKEMDNAGFFQIQLLIKDKKYRYGFTLGHVGTVQQEWLFGPADKNETWYFKRSFGKIELNNQWFEEGTNGPIESLRENTLFLTFVSAYNGPTSHSIRNFIVKNISFENRENRTSANRKGNRLAYDQNASTNQLIKEGKTQLVLDWLESAGLFYSDIALREHSGDFNVVLLEKSMYDANGKIIGKHKMDLDLNESAGTKKFYHYIGLLYQMFTEGGILISDEIDNNFHPSLLQKFIRSFNDKTINKAGAQLLFTSHDTNLLQPNVLRRDQIYFTEKAENEETRLYSLSDLKGIRNNADFARQYLAGFYGALPMLNRYKGLSTDNL